MVRGSLVASLVLAAATAVSADGLAVAYGVWLCDNKDPDLDTVRQRWRHGTHLKHYTLASD